MPLPTPGAYLLRNTTLAGPKNRLFVQTVFFMDIKTCSHCWASKGLYCLRRCGRDRARGRKSSAPITGQAPQPPQQG